MFLPRQQLFDSGELDTVTGPLSMSTTARAGQTTVLASTAMARRQAWPTGSTDERSAVSASDVPASSNDGSARSRGTRPRGAHRATHRRVATKQGRSRLVVAGTASLAGISAILTGMALAGGGDTPAGDPATTGAAPSMGIGTGVSFTEPATTQGHSETGQPSPRLVPPGIRSRSTLSGRTVTGGDPTTAPDDAGRPQVGIPASAPVTGTGTGTAAGDIPAGAPALPVQPGATAPSTDGASNGPTGTGQVATTGNDPAAPAAGPATSVAVSANPLTNTSPPTAVPPGATPPPGTPPADVVAQTGSATAGTAQAPGASASAGGPASSGPEITVPVPVPTTPGIPLEDLSNSVLELRNIAPVWPHSR